LQPLDLRLQNTERSFTFTLKMTLTLLFSKMGLGLCLIKFESNSL